MNPSGLTPWKITRFGGEADWDDSTMIPNGLALKAQNARFRAESVSCRYARKNTMSYATVAADVTGMECLNVLGPAAKQVPLVWLSTGGAGQTGILLQESPAGSGILVPVAQPLTLPQNSHLVAAQAYNRIYFTITDLLKGLAPPLVLDGPSGVLSAIGQTPTGALWAPNTWYQIGDLVRSTDARWWRCTVAATKASTSVPPAWPKLNGNFLVAVFQPATVIDAVSGTHWEEWTPACRQYLPAPDVTTVVPTLTNNPGGGTIPTGKDFYIKLSYIIPSVGEGPRSGALVFAGTGVNDAITVTFNAVAGGGPLMPRWLAELQLQPTLFSPFFLNVWIAAVAHGAAAPADSAYGLYSAEGSIGAVVVVTSTGSIAPNNNGVISVVVTNGGSYTKLPTVSFTGGGGTGAMGHVLFNAQFVGGVILFSVTGVAITASGQNYTSDPNVVFSSGAAAGTSTIGPVGVPTGSNYPQNAGLADAFLGPNAPAVFIGEAGTRYMVVVRQNANGSFSPVDLNSPIGVALVGELQQQIQTILRDGSGNVSATVNDVTGFAPGQQITTVGCIGTATFNGTWVLTNVQMTFPPAGVLSWVDSGHASNANDETGQVILPAGPPPIAFLPPGGPNDIQDIAAFTSAAAQGASPGQLQAGPYSFIPAALQSRPFQANILSMQGTATLRFTGIALTRDAGGMVSAALANIAGISVGQVVTILGASDASFDGTFAITGAVPGTGVAGELTWQQGDQAASTATGATVVVGANALGEVQATLDDASQFIAGDVVEIQGALPSGFNGPVTLASVNGNVVTFPSEASGTATVNANSVMALLQDLPSCAAAGASPLTSISRDANGNVTALIPTLAGWSAGQLAIIAGVADATFNGQFELESASLNNDGITATLAWVQTSRGGISNSQGGTASSTSDIVCNFDDNTLANSLAEDSVTDQLTAIVPPLSIDITYSKNLDRMIYTPGNSSNHYFSNQGDAENVQSPDGILSIDQNNGKKTVCFREMQSGELLSLKENGGYAITQSDLPPAQWSEVNRWEGHGPVGPEAAKVGPDFLIIFAFGTGPYRYADSQLAWIGHEKQGTWDKVNWDARQEIKIEIDPDNKRVFFLLPLKPSTTANSVQMLDYSSGWQDPLIVMLDGSVKPNRYARRWASWPLACRSIRAPMKRTLVVGVDSRINKSQSLFGIAAGTLQLPKSYVQMEVPDLYADDSVTAAPAPVGIDFQYLPAFGRSMPAAGQSPATGVGILAWEMVAGRARGNGPLVMTPTSDDPTYGIAASKVPSVNLAVPAGKTAGTPIKFAKSLGERIEKELLSLNFNNGAIAGNWAELHEMILWSKEVYPCQPAEKSTV